MYMYTYHLLYPLTGECQQRINSTGSTIFLLLHLLYLVHDVVIMHFLVKILLPQHNTEIVLLTG